MFIKKKVIAQSRQNDEYKKRKFENMDRRNTLTVFLLAWMQNSLF